MPTDSRKAPLPAPVTPAPPREMKDALDHQQRIKAAARAGAVFKRAAFTLLLVLLLFCTGGRAFATAAPPAGGSCSPSADFWADYCTPGPSSLSLADGQYEIVAGKPPTAIMEVTVGPSTTGVPGMSDIFAADGAVMGNSSTYLNWQLVPLADLSGSCCPGFGGTVPASCGFAGVPVGPAAPVGGGGGGGGGGGVPPVTPLVPGVGSMCPPAGSTGTTPVALCDAGHVADLAKALHDQWLAAFMDMAQQLTTTAMDQVAGIGELLDAKQQLETQGTLQKLAAEAHRDYQPDLTMCTFGTNMRSLTATEMVNRANTRALDLTMAKRDMLSSDTSAASGNDTDLQNRFEQFKELYCDINDSDHYLVNVCNTTGGPADRINKDIDYTRTVEDKYTMDVDFTNPAHATAPTADEQDVLALTRNLLAFQTVDKVAADDLGQEFAKDNYQDSRSVEAIRSVARNSFAHIIGMRATGTGAPGAEPFMRQIIAQLGATSDADIDTFLGKNPSYYAQMEVLTHKIYENPQFFTNLYTSGQNVERIGVSLQALKLMQDRDRYDSALRREMLVSMLLELQVRERQQSVTNDIQRGLNTLFSSPMP